MLSRMTALTVTVLLVIGLLVSTAQATDLPTGDWTVILNGGTVLLHIGGVDGSGTLTGSTLNGLAITGFYNSSSNEIATRR